MPSTSNDALARTPLHQRHVDAGARMVDFAGFSMPLMYQSILAEHAAVRTACGLFDVSHMGEADFEGPGAIAAVQHLVTNDVATLEDGASLYTVICREDGGIVDDCIVYRMASDRLRIVINAANIQKDLAHFRSHAGRDYGHDCDIVDRSASIGLLAVQGPLARDIVAKFCGPAVLDVPRFGVATATATFDAQTYFPVTVARTGYTGEDGFEVFSEIDALGPLWDALVAAGAVPIGLGARDTLRLEARLHLSGSDMHEQTNPYEAGLGWTVKLGKGAFVGSQALSRIKEEGITRKLVGFVVKDRGIVRPGAEIVDDEGEVIGTVTSGGPAPTLGGAIGLAYVPKELSTPGSELQARQRRKTLRLEVVKGPFYKREST